MSLKIAVQARNTLIRRRGATELFRTFSSLASFCKADPGLFLLANAEGDGPLVFLTAAFLGDRASLVGDSSVGEGVLAVTVSVSTAAARGMAVIVVLLGSLHFGQVHSLPASSISFPIFLVMPTHLPWYQSRQESQHIIKRLLCG